jgi:glycosyltransferase involved in cell wall biosynthesis
MYCGSCLHDNTLAAALSRRGVDILLVPTYTPIRTDEVDVSDRRVFLGGINMFLQQQFPLLRHTPRWLDRWLSHPALLRLATRRASAVDPAQLGAMTVSMLKGTDGNQRKEIEPLVAWLAEEMQPDVVHLSNSMMLGLARPIAAACGTKVICSLSGEDIFLEKLVEPHYSQARQLLVERATEVDGFVAMNNYYADYMADYLAVERTRIEVIPHGLDLRDVPANRPSRDRPHEAPFCVGYFARVCHDKGLHQLVEAAEQLAGAQPDFDFEIVAAGYLGAGDAEYLKQLTHRAARGPLAGRFRYVGEVDRKRKYELLASFDLLCLPTIYRESKGLSVLEALAVGTPVLLPDHGSFPELVAATGGGVTYRAGDGASLIANLQQLAGDRSQLMSLGAAGQQAVHSRFAAEAMAAATHNYYQRVLQGV